MDTTRTARIGAMICIVGSAGAVLFSLALLAGFEPADESPYLLPIYLASLAGVAALALTGAAAGWPGRAGVGVAVAGLLGFIAAEVTAPGPTSDVLYGIAPPATALGMVLAGVAVLRSRWDGWHRYVPLVVGAWIVVVVTPVILLAGDPGTGGSAAAVAAIGAWHLLWAALGVSVLAETRSAERVPA